MKALLAGGEKTAYVAEPRGPEQGVDQRVCDHVPVRMPGEPARVVEVDPAEHKRHAVGERMRVVPHADPDIRHGVRLLSLALRGEQCLDAAEVIRRCHLQQPLVARDHLHPPTCRLDE